MHLSKAPIVEAVIDIQTKPLNPIDGDIINRLKLGHEEIKSEYPNAEQKIFREISVKGGPKADVAINDLVEGFFFRSSDGLRIVQYRRNGFTYSQLKNYKDFEKLSSEANRLWKNYLKCSGEVMVTRLAVRFINKIEIPFPIQNPGDFITEIRRPQTLPSEFSLIRSFSDQALTFDSMSGTSVNLVRFMQEPQRDATQADVIIDIDVFRQVSDIPKESDKIWEIISSFRDVKNRVFFNSVGNKTIEKYK